MSNLTAGIASPAHGIYKHTVQLGEHLSSLEQDTSLHRVLARPEISIGSHRQGTPPTLTPKAAHVAPRFPYPYTGDSSLGRTYSSAASPIIGLTPSQSHAQGQAWVRQQEQEQIQAQRRGQLQAQAHTVQEQPSTPTLATKLFRGTAISGTEDDDSGGGVVSGGGDGDDGEADGSGAGGGGGEDMEAEEPPSVLEFNVVYLRGRYRRDEDVLLRLNMEERQVTVIKARNDRASRVFAASSFVRLQQLTSPPNSVEAGIRYATGKHSTKVFKFSTAEQSATFCGLLRLLNEHGGAAARAHAHAQANDIEARGSGLAHAQVAAASTSEGAPAHASGRSSESAREISAVPARTYLKSRPILLASEDILVWQEHTAFTLHPENSARTPLQRGTLFLTNYRVIFRGYAKTHDTGTHAQGAGGGNAAVLRDSHSYPHGGAHLPAALRRADIPLLCIESIALSAADSSSVLLSCKDCRTVLFTFDQPASWVRGLTQQLEQLVFGGLERAFAFVMGARTIEPEYDGWRVYDCSAELRRQGVQLGSEHRCPWRIYDDNFAMAPTYPRQFVVPALESFSNAELRAVGRFRSNARVPALTYVHHNGAVLARCSQPGVGFAGRTCAEDEKLLALYRLQGRTAQAGAGLSLSIFDARSKIAAEANRMKQKGYENVANYAHTTLVFCGIGNIHTMRDSLAQLRELLATNGEEEFGMHGRLHASGWLKHLQLILKSSVRMARALEAGTSVINHCSDGWDRTAQLCALVQLLLDPHFRTIRGFATLVEKDWCAFGYKFLQRCGHGTRAEQSERSPVFVQWLDGVAQLVRQFPRAFEFTEELLVFCADHVFSGLFGTFLVNFDRQKHLVHKLSTRTTSMWTYVFEHARSFTNPHYTPALGPLWPSWHAHRVTLWERYFLRWDPAMHPPAASTQQWNSDIGTRGTKAEMEQQSVTAKQHIAACDQSGATAPLPPHSARQSTSALGL